MNDESRQLERILAVRDTKRAAARRQLAELAARALKAHAQALAAQRQAVVVEAAAKQRIGDERDTILSGPFPVAAMAELRQTVENENTRIRRANQAAIEAVDAARHVEAERSDAAHKLLSLDGRCRGLTDRLRTLRVAEANARDQHAADEFISIPAHEEEPCRPRSEGLREA